MTSAQARLGQVSATASAFKTGSNRPMWSDVTMSPHLPAQGEAKRRVEMISVCSSMMEVLSQRSSVRDEPPLVQHQMQLR